MEKIEFHSLVIDRCTDCKGMWFDMLEAEQLKEVAGSEQIDIGDPKEGEPVDR